MSARAEQPMGETPSTFHPSFNAGVVIEARVERLTSDAGAVIVREVMERSGIIEWLTERLHDPRQPHLVTPPYSRSAALMPCRATSDDRRPASGGVKRLPGGFGIR